MKPAVRTIIRTGLDRQVPALQAAQNAITQPGKGWLQAVRDAIGMTRSDAGKAIGVTRQSYTAFERAEADRSITLKSLERAAAAMHCEVVYFLVPQQRAGGTFTALAQEHDPVFRHLKKAEHSMSLEGQAVGDLSPPSKPS